MGFFKNWNIITLSHKATTIEAFEEILQVVLDGINYNMLLLVQYGKYGVMNTIYSIEMRSYVILFSEAYTLQEDAICDEKISRASELVFKVQFLILRH